MENYTKYRMYVFVERHLSPIDKGIQAAHAIAEYGMMLGMDEEYNDWCCRDKTIVLLNGGNVNDLRDIQFELSRCNVKFAEFLEPDLDDIPTAVALLVEDKVYNAIPFKEYVIDLMQIEKHKLLELGQENFMEYAKEKWENYLGGETNKVLFELIKSKHLAR